MGRETMTPRERWMATLARQKPDRVPMDYWSTPEVDQMLLRHFRCNDLWQVMRQLHIDRPVDIVPDYVGPERAPGANEFGIVYRKVDYGTGLYDEAVSHPLAKFQTIPEIKANYVWPHPDWYDYRGLGRFVASKEEFPWEGPISEPFYLYKDLRGGEQAFVDLAENPEFVDYCLEKIFEHEYQRILRTLEALPGNITYVFVAEDLGSQDDLMYSLRHIREFFLPRMKRMMKLVHEGGARVMTHSDGAIRRVIPDLIAIGMDVLNPIQWRCAGMDREGLKRDFGDKIILHGGVDNQQTLPFGSVEDVRQEVRDNLRILGAGGGYILAPCHNIQGITPLENILAMYETGYNEG